MGDALSFAKNIENNYFAELLLVAACEPQMILILFLKFGLLSLDAVVLHFLKNSSSVFFKVFKVQVICLYIFTISDQLFSRNTSQWLLSSRYYCFLVKHIAM